MSDDHDLLIQMSEKLDQIHDEVVGTAANPGLRARVDALEGWRDRIKGWLAGAAAVGTVLWGGLEWLFHWAKHAPK